MASGVDSDGAGAGGGAAAFPPFPVQVFVDPARDLTSGFAAEPEEMSGPYLLRHKPGDPTCL